MSSVGYVLAALSVLLLLAACRVMPPPPEPTPTRVPTTPAQSIAPTATPTLTPVPDPTPTMLPTVTPTQTPIPDPTPTCTPFPVHAPPRWPPELPPAFDPALETWHGPGFSIQHPAQAQVKAVPPNRQAWQRASPATAEYRLLGPFTWVKPGDADWSRSGPAYELIVRTYDNPEALDAESWARSYLVHSWQEAQELKRPWGALPVTEGGEIVEGKVGQARMSGQPAFWVSYNAFDSTDLAYYVAGKGEIVELTFNLTILENDPLALVKRDVYALLLSTFRFEGE